ncbi:hypothetical protein V2I01_36785 [Micromonospora sp. BRA006-A]|nr:hypothetical protein [Micromonospora sp. BRA006-A]
MAGRGRLDRRSVLVAAGGLAVAGIGVPIGLAATNDGRRPRRAAGGRSAWRCTCTPRSARAWPATRPTSTRPAATASTCCGGPTTTSGSPPTTTAGSSTSTARRNARAAWPGPGSPPPRDG